MKQIDIYTEALICLRSILLADHPEFQNWIDWLERDILAWTQRREVTHHLRAYGGMGSVSYTHLDVYKRQDLSREDLCGAQ